MYGISQLMSTPVASSSKSESEREYPRELSPTCLFPSFVCDFMDSNSSYECCSIDAQTGSYLSCRRSPRLLTNGYYIWTEDSFLCDENGNITLNPSQTSVLYKENLVRVFRKKKRLRRSFSSLFNLKASKSWLHDDMFDDADPSPSDAIWLDGFKRMDMHHCKENGDNFESSLTDEYELEKLNAECMTTSSSGNIWPEDTRKNFHDVSHQSQTIASEHFQGNILEHSKICLWQEVSFQAILLVACLIISTCARWFWGGILAAIFTGSLMITIIYVVKSLFLSLASYFKVVSCIQSCPKSGQKH